MGIDSPLSQDVQSRDDLPLDLTSELEVLTGRTSTICQQSIDQDGQGLQLASSPCRLANRELLQHDFLSWTQFSSFV